MNTVDAVFIDFSCRKLEQMAARIEHCLGELSDEQIWARANEHSNSTGNLVLHLAGNVRQWIISGVGGEPDQRQRDAEFAARGGQTKAELIELLGQTVRKAIGTLRRLPHDKLLERMEIQGFHVTVLESVFHVVEHFSGHTFQIILLTKAAQDCPLDFYGYLDGSHEDQTP